MARSRNIKPGFFKNEDLGTADPFVSLLFAGMWTLADRSGILEDRPLRIKAELFPYRDNFDINRYITVLVSLGFIHRYEINGLKLIQIINFTKHQNPHHTEKKSEYPEYTIDCKLSVIEPLNNGITPADSLNIDSLNSDSLIPDSLELIPEGSGVEKTTPPKKTALTETPLQIACRDTWSAYRQAYDTRYGIEPIRNAKVNGQIKLLVGRLGGTDAPFVAAHYLTNNLAYYVQRGHSLDCLLADAEKLRTEWATGRSITATRARQIDQTQSNASAVDEALALMGDKNAHTS